MERVLAVKSFKPLKLEISDAGTGASSMASPCGTHRAIHHMQIGGAKLGMCNDGVHGNRRTNLFARLVTSFHIFWCF